MSKQNLKSQAKRKRELAKLDKRQAKDQKRALRKAELRSEPGDVVVTPLKAPVSPAATLKPVLGMRVVPPVPPPKPLTFAEAALRWKNTKIPKPKTW
jgi:hypothetical protein